LGLNYNEFYRLTPIEFYYALKDWKECQENNQRFSLEVMRLQTFYLLNIQLSRENRYRKPSDMMPFTFDKDKIDDDFEIPTPEKWKQLQEEFNKLKFSN
jgi:hypothetical protein